MPPLILGTPGDDTLWGVAGTDTKIDAKGGDDFAIGSNGNDLIIGGDGSDVLFGGTGRDTFVFDKFAHADDTDYITDFQLGIDSLIINNGATLLGASASKSAETEFNGHSLTNDANVYDLKLTFQVVDGSKTFTYDVTLVDALKNDHWHADQWDTYLSNFNYSGGIDFNALA